MSSATHVTAQHIWVLLGCSSAGRGGNTLRLHVPTVLLHIRLVKLRGGAAPTQQIYGGPTWGTPLMARRPLSSRWPDADSSAGGRQSSGSMGITSTSFTSSTPNSRLSNCTLHQVHGTAGLSEAAPAFRDCHVWPWSVR